MSASTERKNRIAAREAGNDRKAQVAAEEAKLKAKSKTRWTLGTVAIVLLIAAAILLNTGFLYTKTPAVKINNVSYSPAQVGYYYGTQYNNFLNTYGDYASYFGLNTSSGIKGLATQNFSDTQTWKEYFLDQAIQQMKQIQAYGDYASANGVTLTSEQKAEIDDQLNIIATAAPNYGYKDVNSFLTTNYGKGVNSNIFRAESERYALANAGYNAFVSTLNYSDEELAEYYAGLEGAYDIYVYALYTVSAEDTDEDGTISEEELAAAEATAKAIVTDYYKDKITKNIVTKLSSAAAKHVEGASASKQAVTSQNLTPSYAEWLQSKPAEGQVKTFVNAGNNAVFVIANISYDNNDYNTASVRHILVMVDPDENGEYTEEAMTAAKLEAEEILNTWKSGEATEESFAALADELSDDSAVGGLYETIDRYSYVDEFTAFAFGEHEHGDTGIVYGQSDSYRGYHVMYYVGEGPLYSAYIAKNLKTNADIEAWSADLTSKYTAETTGWLRYAG